MKVKCINTTSKYFDLKEVTTVFSNNFDYSFGGYGITLDEEYIVMGMAIYKGTNCLYYLIDTNGKPDWFPYLLFNVINNTLPEKWFMKINNKSENSDLYLLWGFEELCNDNKFYDKLIDREEDSMRIYFKRKEELENKYNS